MVRKILIPKKLSIYQYLSKVKVAKTFFLKPVIPQEIFDIILSYMMMMNLILQC